MARVLFFGRLRDMAGASPFIVDAPTLSALRRQLAAQNPALGDALASPGILVAVDHSIRRDDASLQADTEVAFMPPLSGG